MSNGSDGDATAPPFLLKHSVLRNLDDLSRRDKRGMKRLRRYLRQGHSPRAVLRYLVRKDIIDPAMERPFRAYWGRDRDAFRRLCDRFIKAFRLARRDGRELDCWVMSAGDGEPDVLVRRQGSRVRVIVSVPALPRRWILYKIMHSFDPGTLQVLEEQHGSMSRFLEEFSNPPRP